MREKQVAEYLYELLGTIEAVELCDSAKKNKRGTYQNLDWYLVGEDVLQITKN